MSVSSWPIQYDGRQTPTPSRVGARVALLGRRARIKPVGWLGAQLDAIALNAGPELLVFNRAWAACCYRVTPSSCSFASPPRFSIKRHRLGRSRLAELLQGAPVIEDCNPTGTVRPTESLRGDEVPHASPASRGFFPTPHGRLDTCRLDVYRSRPGRNSHVEAARGVLVARRRLVGPVDLPRTGNLRAHRRAPYHPYPSHVAGEFEASGRPHGLRLQNGPTAGPPGRWSSDPPYCRGAITLRQLSDTVPHADWENV